MENLLIKTGNLFTKAILHSPLQALVSENLMLITFTGRKTSNLYASEPGYDSPM
jgi:hypothetical protein